MQCISRIEGESKNGVHYKVLDDFIEEIGEDVLKNPPAAIKRAYQEIAIEEKLLKDAKKRGIDPKILKATARNLNIQERCAKSIFSKPKPGLQFIE